MYRILLLLIPIVLLSCSDSDKPDVSNIKVDVSIERFEKDFFTIDTTNIPASLTTLQTKYPDFYPIFMQEILGVSLASPTPDLTPIHIILSAYKPIYDSIEKKYSNFNWLENDLESSLKYVKYYYPAYSVPKFITYIASFDIPGVIVTKDYIGIGLHQFAGKDFSAYKLEQIQQIYPSYISRRFDKEYIKANVIKAVVDDIYPDRSVGKPLIEQMVEKGKHWYILSKFLPGEPDSTKTGYTTKQLEWVESNEGNIWAHLTKNENIYSIEPHVIQTYLGESPFTQGMPEISPGNLGQWIGWKIVEEYAKKNPEISLPQLIATPARTIFEGANYRPK